MTDERTLPPPAIGHVDDFKKEDGSLDYDKLAGKVIDGPTGFVFASIDDWYVHESPASGTVPTDPQYLIKTTTPNWAAITAKAKERGAQQDAGV